MTVIEHFIKWILGTTVLVILSSLPNDPHTIVSYIGMNILWTFYCVIVAINKYKK